MTALYLSSCQCNHRLMRDADEQRDDFEGSSEEVDPLND